MGQTFRQFDGAMADHTSAMDAVDVQNSSPSN
jgi:hypothetical protein